MSWSVNFPFSSTAFLVNNIENSIFFDPTSELDIDDEAAAGIRLINNLNDLDKYIYSRIYKS